MLSMVDVDRLDAGVKIHCGLALFLEGVGARSFESAEGSVERETRGGLVDLDYTRIDLIRERKSFLQIIGDHARRQTETDGVGFFDGIVDPLRANDADDRTEDFLLSNAHGRLDVIEDSGLGEVPFSSVHFAAEQQPGTFLLTERNVVLTGLQLILIDERSHLHAVLKS